MDEKSREEMRANLKIFARGVIESKAREEAGRILIRMKDRFTTLFSRDSDSMPWVWTGKEDIRGITKNARAASLKLLSVMAAIRLEDEPDNISKTLSAALVDSSGAASSNRSLMMGDPLASNKRNNNWLPPPWAIVAMLVLGFNEFTTLLRNPLYLGVIFVGYLLFKALWVQMDISAEFRNGALPGLLSISTKFLPVVTNLLRNLAEQGQAPPAITNPQGNPALATSSFQNNISSTASSDVTGADTGSEYSSPKKQD